MADDDLADARHARRVDLVARAFHEVRGELAVDHGWENARQRPVPWDSVPEPNRELLTATIARLLDDAVITLGPAVTNPLPPTVTR